VPGRQEGSVRKKRALLSIGAVAGLLTLTVAPAVAVPPHLHCLNLENGRVVALGGGVTSHAPHDIAFHNLHFNVHVGVPGSGPLTITADTTAPYTCPPTP
jgi:hypothetical protein